MIRIALATLGCKTNAYESAAIFNGFDPANHILVPFDEEADIYIVNTCTVTGRTDFKSRNLIRKALSRKEQNPKVKVVVTGCFAQNHPDEVAALGAVDLIADNQNKLDIATLIDDNGYKFEQIFSAREFRYRPLRGMVEHSRAFQKIQDGCDYVCAYCAVHIARGPSRSAMLEDVIGQARLFVDSGYREIVLGGVNLGLYRDGANGLAEVVEALDAISGLELVRLSSLEPQLLNAELIDRISQSQKLCPHFHIPLQSGSDDVLQRMGRRYSTSLFQDLIGNLHRAFPSAAIGMDVITGFPGETSDEFDQTCEFLSRLDFAYLHVFSFSRREGTPAATMPNQVPNQEKNRRTNVLSVLSDQKKQVYMSYLINNRVPLRGVCESIEDNAGTCLSDHYVRVYAPFKGQPGNIMHAIPEKPWLDGVWGSATPN